MNCDASRDFPYEGLSAPKKEENAVENEVRKIADGGVHREIH